MDSSLLAVIPLAEVIEEFRGYLRDECGRPDMANDFVPALLVHEFEYVARVAINRTYVNVHSYLARTRELFTRYDSSAAEKATDMADEMYLLVRNELPERIAKEKNIYSIELKEGCLHIFMLVSGRALSYGIDPQPLIDLVV